MLRNSFKNLILQGGINMNEIRKTGTTTVGILTKDAVVLAADRRATAGNMIVDKEVRKVVKITDKLGITIAGHVADVQLLCKYLRSEMQLMTLRTGRHPTVKEASNLLASWVYSVIRRMFPGITHFLVGGFDSAQRLYDVSPDGSLSQVKDFYASGSGSVFAIPILDTNYKTNMSTDEAIALATKAIDTALQHDSASGNGILIAVIDKNGYREVMDKLVTTRL